MDRSPVLNGPPITTGNAPDFGSSLHQNFFLPITTENETTTVTPSSQAVLPSTISSFEPYTPSNYRGRGRGGRGRTQNNRLVKHNKPHRMDIPFLNQNISNHNKSVLIKARKPEIENLWLKVNILKANKELEHMLKGSRNELRKSYGMAQF